MASGIRTRTTTILCILSIVTADRLAAPLSATKYDDPDNQPWIGKRNKISSGQNAKMVSRAVDLDRKEQRHRLRPAQAQSKPIGTTTNLRVKHSEQEDAVKKAEQLALAVAQKRAEAKKAGMFSSEVSPDKCTNVVFSGGGPASLMGVYSVQSGKFNGGPYYKCGKAFLYRKIAGKGWAIANSLGDKRETMFSQASGDVQMSLTDKYTMWSSISSSIPGPGEAPKYNLVRKLHVHCFSGQPLAGDCDASLSGRVPSVSAYSTSQYYGSTALGAANPRMQLALRMQEQQSLQQATNNALEQQELQTATVAAALAERKQAKLRRQMLMRNCLQRYETSPLLLQTCLAQIQRSQVGYSALSRAEQPPLFP